MASPSSTQNSSLPQCSICLEDVIRSIDRATARLGCGHVFHLDCIGSEFNFKCVMQCPNCRVVEDGKWLFASGGFDDNEEESEEENNFNMEWVEAFCDAHLAQFEEIFYEVLEHVRSRTEQTNRNNSTDQIVIVSEGSHPSPNPVPNVHLHQHSWVSPATEAPAIVTTVGGVGANQPWVRQEAPVPMVSTLGRSAFQPWVMPAPEAPVIIPTVGGGANQPLINSAPTVRVLSSSGYPFMPNYGSASLGPWPPAFAPSGFPQANGNGTIIPLRRAQLLPYPDSLPDSPSPPWFASFSDIEAMSPTWPPSPPPPYLGGGTTSLRRPIGGDLGASSSMLMAMSPIWPPPPYLGGRYPTGGDPGASSSMEVMSPTWPPPRGGTAMSHPPRGGDPGPSSANQGQGGNSGGNGEVEVVVDKWGNRMYKFL